MEPGVVPRLRAQTVLPKEYAVNKVAKPDSPKSFDKYKVKVPDQIESLAQLP